MAPQVPKSNLHTNLDLTNDPTAIISKGDFFKDRVNSIKELVSNRHIYNRREKEKAKLLAEKTSKPFALGYGSDWGNVYSGLGLMGTLFSIAAICMGVDFSSKPELFTEVGFCQTNS